MSACTCCLSNPEKKKCSLFRECTKDGACCKCSLRKHDIEERKSILSMIDVSVAVPAIWPKILDKLIDIDKE